MPTKLCRWGNSIGLRIGKYQAEVAGLRIGDEVYVRLLDSGDLLVSAAKPRKTPGGSFSGAVVEKTDEQILAEW